MQYINSPVSTLCIGQASSMGSFLLAAGEKGKDILYLIPNYGSPTFSWFSRTSNRYSNSCKRNFIFEREINNIYSKHTGKSVKDISEALERDNFMTAEEAKNFGLIDSVVEKENK